MLNHEEEQRQFPIREVREIATPLPSNSEPDVIDQWERILDRAIPVVDRTLTMIEKFMEGRSAGQQRQQDIEAIPLHRTGYRVSEDGIIPLSPSPIPQPTYQPTSEVPTQISNTESKVEPMNITEDQLEYLWIEAIAGLKNLGGMPVSDAVVLAENHKEDILATIRERLNQLDGETISDSGIEG